MWKRNNDNSGFLAKKKIGNQEIIVGAYDDEYNNNRFYIDACVYSKRKNISSNFYDKEVTGNSGLKPLLEIRKLILSLEKFLTETINPEIEIVIYWTDSRRRDAYIYGLKDYGYKIGMRNNRKCLFKKINNDENKEERC